MFSLLLLLLIPEPNWHPALSRSISLHLLANDSFYRYGPGTRLISTRVFFGPMSYGSCIKRFCKNNRKAWQGAAVKVAPTYMCGIHTWPSPSTSVLGCSTQLLPLFRGTNVRSIHHLPVIAVLARIPVAQDQSILSPEYPQPIQPSILSADNVYWPASWLILIPHTAWFMALGRTIEGVSSLPIDDGDTINCTPAASLSGLLRRQHKKLVYLQ